MKKYFRILVYIIFLQWTLSINAQIDKANPKLVIGIVVDQMRFDYLYRFSSLFGEDGFKKLMNEGSNFTYAHFNYVPTFTAPGHTSIYTGTTPYFHGIIANAWYDKETKKEIYCTSDDSASTVGANDDHGKESPHRLMATTITDQLKLAANGRSKVISVSMKDRASILPGGHMPDAAYWYDPLTGDFISSTYYMKQLPGWVNDFNKRKLAEKYMSGSWDLSYPLEKYENTLPDKQPFEADLFNEKKTSFPHSFQNVTEKKKADLLLFTPYGNQILMDFIKSAIENEKLGKGKYTDFLAVSFSSTDYIGHSYGPNSVEVEDTYIKLDKIFSELIKELDRQIGKNTYVLFLTADHAVDESPSYLNEKKIPSGWFDPAVLKDSLINFSKEYFKEAGILENLSNKQIFLNHNLIRGLKLNLPEVREDYVEYIKKTFPLISQIYSKDDFKSLTAFRTSPNLILNGLNPTRSGDLAFELQPGYQYGKGGDATTHGSIYNYDTHAPLIFYGWHIPKQTINTPVFIVDIAATVANLLNIQEPSACMGIPIIK